ncbi:hypothetical protein L484_012608 [Morus notabilis]|uniref:Transcription repressor n=2 Tax=Morus notabilis TaxID=981085 RepID=W9QKU7_9ROSA|nr:hypothetical protein L484_012608 [Morus notabilis]
MKLPHFLSTKHHPWRQWPSYSCNHNPKTLSYRFDSDDVFRTVNSVFFDPNDAVDTPESWFTNSSESASFSGATTESDDFPDGESLETLVAGARSERRLFFEPGGDTSSILAEKSSSGNFSGVLAGAGEISQPLRESVVLAMESDDPYRDFRRSMEEMVEINGVKEWEGLEEMLGWYLRVNGKENHGFIVGAFMDLLVELANNSGRTDDCNDVHSAATTTTTTITTATDSFSSAVSCFPDHEPLITCSCSRRHEEERNLTG